MSQSPFSAAASTLGYLYQLRYALALGMGRIQSGSYEWALLIEAADDIEVTDGNVRQLRQLKQTGRPLTDYDSNLWKTLRIWAQGIGRGEIDPLRTMLFLVTTASTPNGSIASLLSHDVEIRNEELALQKLLAVCSSSTSAENRPYYDEFTKLTMDEQRAMLRSITVITNESDVSNLEDRLTAPLRVGTRREHLSMMVERLEGWWFSKCIECMVQGKDNITAEQLDAFVVDVREQFNPSNLPIDFDIIGLPEPDGQLFSEKVFVQQAHLAKVNERRIQIAVREYMRAFAQRSRWLEQNLLQPDELESYQRIIREEWEIVFEQLRDDVGEDATEDEKIKAARKLYAWVESAVVPPIRSQCTEGFVKRGSLHILADNLVIGWHPEFIERLSDLLNLAEARS